MLYDIQNQMWSNFFCESKSFKFFLRLQPEIPPAEFTMPKTDPECLGAISSTFATVPN